MFQLLSEKHIGIQLLGQFANGRVETLIPGITYTNERMRQVDESRLIAKQVRVFHDLNLEIDRHPTYLTSIRKLVDTVGRKCLDSKFQQFVNYHQLKQDVEELEIFLNQVPSRLVLSHNDLQYGNIMKNEQGQAVLIDFEYTSYNPRGYDVGNHFCEWAYDYHKTINPHIGDFTKYPTKEEQRNFCPQVQGLYRILNKAQVGWNRNVTSNVVLTGKVKLLPCVKVAWQVGVKMLPSSSGSVEQE
ncbi:unnamed protein product [Peronospora belbahrii]|uniref:Choline/ethanolamine kinase n=1 Tax=Peronospora belbahrii TaxID=622444 RepID=A0ABN8CUY7_9STRA|nr:unnamed protein product [Peronospora belbahrii]